MPTTSLKVELEFFGVDINDTLFILDDEAKGKLDDPSNTLSGFIFVDVTNFVTGVNMQRGKSRLLDRFEAGTALVTFDNSKRDFDPKYVPSPFHNAIYPRLNIRISVNNIVQFTGVVQDWNFEYDPAGPSTASATVSDRFTNLTQSFLESNFQELEFSGSRVNAVLDTPEVNWPSDLRDIDAGRSLLQEDLIPENTDALSYLQLVETSEQGQLFIAKNGNLVFHERSYAPSFNVSFSDSAPAPAIPFSEITVVYGTELLFNRIEANPLGDLKEIAFDLQSETAYGVSTLNLTDLLNEDPLEVESMVQYLLSIFKEPEYRFDTITVAMHKLATEAQDLVLGLELSDIVFAEFTPSKLPPAIEEFSTIIKISHEIDVAEHFVTFSLGSTLGNPLILDNEVLGVLDVNTLIF